MLKQWQLWVLTMLALAPPALVRAYTIKTGFTEGACHERLSLAAYLDTLRDLSAQDIPLPNTTRWQNIYQELEAQVVPAPITPQTQEQRYLLHSLLLGVRYPDLQGHSITNISQQRLLQQNPNPDLHYQHALRALQDDGPEGDQAVINGTRRHIIQTLNRALESWQKTAAEQHMQTQVYVEFYGQVSVSVWQPAFELGVALHALQDSFSHSIRPARFEQQRIAHVLNFADAISKNHDPERDGERHSYVMDSCDAETFNRSDYGQLARDLFAASTQASMELSQAWRQSQQQGTSDASAAVTPVLDAWITLIPNCTRANRYCDSEAEIAFAEADATDPILLDCALDAPYQRQKRGHDYTLIALGLWMLWQRLRVRCRKTPSL